MGLFGTQNAGSGLFGAQQAQPPAEGPTFTDYALALLAGGTKGLAGYALQNRAAGRERQRQQPFLDQLNAAFDPQEVMRQESFAPRATEENGVFSRQLQAPVHLNGEKQQTVSTGEAPTISSLAPSLFAASRAGVDTSPYLDMFKALQGEHAANQPKLFNTTDGLVSVGPNGTNPQMVLKASEKKRPAPANYRWNEDGDLEFIPGGAADPEVIKKGAQTRRSVIASTPLPSRARASGASGAKPPWKNDWSK